MTRVSLAALLLFATACGRGASPEELARLHRERVNATDPAITAALADPIMSDRDLTVADNSRRVRYVRGPAEASTPARITANAAVYSALRGLEPPRVGCEAGFRYGPAWAARLPAPFAVPPGASLVEAGGNDRRGCASVVAVFRVPAPADRAAAALRARALTAGYAGDVRVRGADHVVGGRRARDGASVFAVASPRAGGSEVALLASAGALR